VAAKRIGVLALQGDVREHLITLAGLGVTEAKKKFVYPAKPTGRKIVPASPQPRQPATNPEDPGEGKGMEDGPDSDGGVHVSVASDAASYSDDGGDHDATDTADGSEIVGQTLAGELEEIAQRLTEIAQDEIGKVAWSQVEWRKAKNAVAASQKVLVVLNRRLNNEQPFA